MSCITMIKEIKSIHPEDIALIRLGSFYKAYGKDAYIVSKIFEYKTKEEERIISCGFLTKAINKVKATLEKKKINYMLIESTDNYRVDEKEKFKVINFIRELLVNIDKNLENFPKKDIEIKNRIRN